MAALELPKERMERHLREACLRDDSDAAAFWADAMDSWDRPIPDYARSELNQFSLKERVGATISESTRNQGISESIFGPESYGAKGSFRR